MVVEIAREDKLGDIIEKLNREINGRRSYGRRREELPSTKKVTGCVWSNGSASWYCGEPSKTLNCKDGSEAFKAAYNLYMSILDSCSFPIDFSVLDRFHTLKEQEHISCKPVVSKTQCLDANEIVVVGAKRGLIQSLAPVLNDLPLHRGSYEAREKGIFSLKGIDIPPGIQNVPHDALDPQTVKALVDKALEIMTEEEDE